MPEFKYAENVAVTSREDKSGIPWFTARYRSLNLAERSGSTLDQQLFLAEGGSSGRCSRQKIYWYPSEREALDALTIVFIVSNWAAKQTIQPPLGLLGPWDLFLRESGGEATSELLVKLPESDCRPCDFESDSLHSGPAGHSMIELESSLFESNSLHSVPTSRPEIDRETSPNPPAKRLPSSSPNKEPKRQCIVRLPTKGQSCFLRPGERFCSIASSKLGKDCWDLHIQQAPLGSANTEIVVDITEDPFFIEPSFTNLLRPVNEKDDNDVWHHTIAFVNVKTNVFILPHGGKGQCNDSGVWWYTTKGDAYEAIAKTVGRIRAVNNEGF
jgi:hypothetical protein